MSIVIPTLPKPPTARIAAWLLMLPVGCVAVCQGGVVAGTMSSVFAIDLPWWAYSLLAMASVAILGYRNIDLSARVLSLIVIAEYLAILRGVSIETLAEQTTANFKRLFPLARVVG